MNKPDWPSLEDAVKAGEGFLTDAEIAQSIEKGQLISDGAVPGSAKYACYEVHIGPHVQQLVVDDTPGGEGDLYHVKNTEGGVFKIQPGETFKIYAAEEMYIPANVFAITIPVGNMYKLGLNPETTFADPGYAGPFYVTVCNYSKRIVKLTVGDPLARVFFFKLSKRPEKIHDSKTREVPPAIERVPRPDLSNLENESALLEGVLNLVDPPHYEHAFVTQRIFSHHHKKTDTRLLQLRRDNARLTMISLASLFAVIVFFSIRLGVYLRSLNSSYFDSITANILTPIIIWVVLFSISPLRRQLLEAVGTLWGGGDREL